MLISSGVAVKTPTFPGVTSDWFYNYERPGRWGAYHALFRSQTWVYVLVSKRGRSLARLPLKTYIRDDLNRPEAPAANPYKRLIDKPNPTISPFRFWEWTSNTYDVFGETFWYKRRDRGGRPFELWPLHPTGMSYNADTDRWEFRNTRLEVTDIKPADLVHFKSYNPGDDSRGLSPLEPLRATLEHETAAKSATSSFWQNGARPGFVLKHPANLSDGAQTRLKKQFESEYSGTSNTGKSLVLEEGMEPFPLMITPVDSEYIAGRKLNREEVCAVYDMPPPAVQILDNATYSNITEQMRSLYRDTMAALISAFESDLDTQLRMPDFADDVYAEFLLDGVLRGDFEQRAVAYSKADYMTVAEKRRAENLPFIEGTDVILVNTATLPLDRLNDPGPIDAGVAGPTNKPPAQDTADTADNAAQRTIRVPAQRLDVGLRTVMGRLGTVIDPDDIDERSLIEGLDPAFAQKVIAEVQRAKYHGLPIAELRSRLKTIQKEIAA